MPKRLRSGDVSSPARVVAPISVNGWSGTFTDRARRALADHDVELVVLERRVEDLLDRRRHPVDLVDEEDLALLEVREHRRQVAGLLEHRARRGPHRHAQFVADDVRQRRLAEPGRAVEQDVVERLAALPGGRDRRRAGSRARGPARCTRRASAGRSPASNCASSSSARVGVTRSGSSVSLVVMAAIPRASSRSACFSTVSKVGDSARAQRGVDGLLRERSMISQVQQRREQVAAQLAARRAGFGPGRRLVDEPASGSLSFSSRPIRSAVFLPTPGMAVSRATSPACTARTRSADVDAREHRQRELRPDAADADQPLEDLLLERRRRSRTARACLRARACARAAPRRRRARRACRTSTAAPRRRSRRRRRRR